MSKQQIVKGYMFMELDSDWSHGDYEEKWWARWKEYKATESAKLVFIREMEITFDLPVSVESNSLEHAKLLVQHKARQMGGWSYSLPRAVDQSSYRIDFLDSAAGALYERMPA